MATDHARFLSIIGMRVVDAKRGALGECTDAYREGGQWIIVIDNDYELPIWRYEIVLDFIRGPDLDFARVYTL